jgi:CDP-4-dehydro-6-deoxyglucose reductase, E3
VARTIYQARLKQINTLTPLVRELVIEFKEPPQMDFQAGQFVMLHVPDPGNEKPILRAYSLASDDKIKTQFKLIIKLFGEGVASQFIRDLKGGEELQFTGPFGKLLFKQPPAEQVLFLCTGAGLSQHMSFLLSHGEKYPNTKFHLLVGVWNEGEIFYEKEIAGLKIKNFTSDFVLDKPADSWKGKKGFVTDFLDQFNYNKIDTQIYLCGNPAMIKGAKDHLVEKNLFSADRIFAESFG